MEFKNLPASAFLIVSLVFASGLSVACTSLFFQPTAIRYPYLEIDQLSAKIVTLKSKDETKISAWEISSVEARKNHPEILPAKNLKPNEVRGIALQFHGNAQNMTSHYRFQMWLLFEGWDVLTFDYRGYGMSEGSTSNLGGIEKDGEVAIEWANKIARDKNLPLIIFAQSLGASLAISSLAETSVDRLKLLVVDSGFYSFTSIAREKLGGVWFLWPLQWLGWLAVSNDLSAGPKLENPAYRQRFSTEAIFLHSVNDPVVSNLQGEKLFAAYPGEKLRWTTSDPGHVNTLFAEVDQGIPPRTPYREKLKLKLRAIQGAWFDPEAADGPKAESKAGPIDRPMIKAAKPPASK